MAMERSTNLSDEVTVGRKKNALNKKDGEQLTEIGGGLTGQPQLMKLRLSEAHRGLKEFHASVGLG